MYFLTQSAGQNLTFVFSISAMADSYRNIISAAGENVDREGIVDTPMRAAKAFAFFTKVHHISDLLSKNEFF